MKGSWLGSLAPNRAQPLLLAARWTPVVLLAGALAGAAGFAISNAQPSEYRATAQLYVAPAVNPTAAVQDVALAQSLAKTYVQFATGDSVLNRASQTVSWSDYKNFRERTQAAQVRDTSLIAVSFRAQNPQRAAEIANLIANLFVEQVRLLESSLQSGATSQLDDQIQTVQADILRTAADLSQLRSSLVSLPSAAPQRGELQAQLAQLESSQASKQQSLAQLLRSRDDLRLVAARAQNTLTLAEPAVAPTDRESPRTLLNTMAASLGGALLALAGLALFRYLDDRMTDDDDVHERLGVPALGMIASGPGRTKSGGLFVRDDPSSAIAEGFRAVRTNLIFASVDRPPRTMMVTSAVSGEGKSIVSSNMALAFAESGSLTILIDADLRRPALHRLFGLKSTVGLTNLLAGSLTVSEIGLFQVERNLIVVPSGQLPLNRADLLASTKMSSLIAELSRLSDSVTVIMDTGPVLAVADALALSTKVDGCVIVVDSGHTHARATQRALAALSAVHARILGVVLNKVAAVRSDYYGRYASSGGGSAPNVVRDAEVAGVAANATQRER